MKINTNPVKGTVEFLPKDAEIREIVRQKIIGAYQKNGFLLIETPILESLDLLDKSDEGENKKYAFKTIKRGAKLDLAKPNLTEKDIVEEGLRYDLTVPLARFFCNNKEKLPVPFKSIQCGYSFRAEKPQLGRYRQFVQCDVDIFGDKTVNAEIELLSSCMNAFSLIGFEKVVLKVNNRQILNQIIITAGFDKADINSVCIALDKLDKIGLEGVKNELCAKEFKLIFIEKLLKAIDDIKNKGISVLTKYGVQEETFVEMKKLVDLTNKVIPKGFQVVFEISIVRGQGYYTGSVFEIYADGFSGAVGGGGRYDNMVKEIVGQDVPAVGISIGFEPTMLILLAQNKIFQNKRIALFFDDSMDFSKVIAEKNKLSKDFFVSVFARPKNFKNMILKLKENGFSGYLVLGDSKVTDI